MNIKQAKDEIKNTVKAYLKKDEKGTYIIPLNRQRPILLMGAPGLGKTAVMRQIADEEGIGLVSYNMTHHTRQSALGLPLIEKSEYDGQTYEVTRYTMSEIIASVYDRIEETGIKEGILFLDEINCVSETLTPVILQLLQAKMFGRTRIPEGWIVVAAGNPEEYNSSVREFDMATLDRVRRIDIEPDFGVWRSYAMGSGVSGDVLSYLTIRSENFYKAYITADGMNFVTARGWEDLSDIIKAYEELDIEIGNDQIRQYISDPETALDFANFRNLYKKYENIYPTDEALEGRASDTLKERFFKAPFDEKVSVVGLLLSALNKNFVKSWENEKVTDKLFSMIKRFQAGDESETFEKIISDEERQNIFVHNADIGSEKEYECVRRAILTAKIWISGNDWSGEKADVTGKLQKKFFELNEINEEYDEKTEEKLNNAFDFLENASGSGSEIVLFVNELAGGYYSLRFVREQRIERFFEYNSKLFKKDESRAELLGEI